MAYLNGNKVFTILGAGAGADGYPVEALHSENTILNTYGWKVYTGDTPLYKDDGMEVGSGVSTNLYFANYSKFLNTTDYPMSSYKAVIDGTTYTATRIVNTSSAVSLYFVSEKFIITIYKNKITARNTDSVSHTLTEFSNTNSGASYYYDLTVSGLTTDYRVDVNLPDSDREVAREASFFDRVEVSTGKMTFFAGTIPIQAVHIIYSAMKTNKTYHYGKVNGMDSDNNISASDLEQTTGTASDKVMSQGAVTYYLGQKLDSSNIVQTTGTATDKVMSQKAITDELLNYDKEYNEFLPSDSDFNSLKECSTYVFAKNKSFINAPESPLTFAGTVKTSIISTSGSTTYKYQVLRDNRENLRYTRNFLSGSWTDWKINIPKKIYASGNIFFQVKVNQDFPNYVDQTQSSQDTQTYANVNCVLQLPSTYTQRGTKTKLVMIAHGAGNFVGTNTAPGGFTNFSWLTDNGYAIFDCNGSMAGATASTGMGCGGPRAIEGYRKAYEYIIENYNIDEHLIVFGQSMGGLTAINFVNKNPDISVCCAALYPITDMKTQIFNNNTLKGMMMPNVAREYNFNDNTGETWEADKVIGYDPINKNAITINDTKYIFQNVPIKIWHGTADTTVPYQPTLDYINAIKAAGGIAELRTVEGASHGTANGWANVINPELLYYINRF